MFHFIQWWKRHMARQFALVIVEIGSTMHVKHVRVLLSFSAFKNILKTTAKPYSVREIEHALVCALSALRV
jgi:hypothetical protein